MKLLYKNLFRAIFIDKILQIQPNPCANSPCNNGGVCQAGAAGSYVCNCVGGYSGRNCEVSKSLVFSNYCYEL